MTNPSPPPRPLLGPRAATAFSLALVLLTAWPVVENWRETPRDDFPFSYYPMFSHRRGETYVVQHFVGLGADGSRHYVSSNRVGAGGHNQVRRQVRLLVKKDRAGALCLRVAERIAPRKRYAEIETLRVVSARYGLDAWFDGDQEPVAEKIHAQCAVERELS